MSQVLDGNVFGTLSVNGSSPMPVDGNITLTTYNSTVEPYAFVGHTHEELTKIKLSSGEEFTMEELVESYLELLHRVEDLTLMVGDLLDKKENI